MSYEMKLELSVEEFMAIGYAISAGRQDAREHMQWEIAKALESLFVKIHGAAKEWKPEPLAEPIETLFGPDPSKTPEK